MFTRTYNRKLCLFSILVLLFWSMVSGAVSVSEITEAVCCEQDSYVNHTSSNITPAGRHIPAQEYLSAWHFGTEESVSATRGRSVKPLTRNVRHISAGLFCSGLLAAAFAVFGQLSYRQIPSYCSYGIIIINYIHHKDGRKSPFLFTQPKH